jgi:hypothetical protein
MSKKKIKERTIIDLNLNEEFVLKKDKNRK